MILFFPILFAVAGTCIILLFSDRIRQHKALAFKARQLDRDRVVVEGQTYSEAANRDEKVKVEPRSGSSSASLSGQVENVRRVCIIGAGKEGAITGIVLVSQNQEVEFCVADANERLIKAWRSDNLPFFEPGLKEMFFDDDALHARGAEDETENEKPASPLQDHGLNLHISARGESIARVERRRKLSNLGSSTDVHAVVKPAELIFLCLEPEPSADALVSILPSLIAQVMLLLLMSEQDGSSPHSYLDCALQFSALASMGHKIIVQRTTAPYGATAYIRTRLSEISSPKATYKILANPSLDLPLPGSLISSMLAPSSILIGHIFAPMASTSAITALKRLYAYFVPEDRIVTMDAYSAELGAISAKGVLAQQIVSVESVRLLCDEVEASTDNVGWMLRGRCGPWLILLRGLGMEDVKAYWESVLRLEEMKYRREVRDLARILNGGEEQKEVALISTDAMGDRETALVLLDELQRAEVMVRVWFDLVGSLEDACAGCNAVILHGSLGITDDVMQVIADRMEEPKALLRSFRAVPAMSR
ncbi:hypothetical protein BDW66DRAFT_166877 [Aspergillus desertorum]